MWRKHMISKIYNIHCVYICTQKYDDIIITRMTVWTVACIVTLQGMERKLEEILNVFKIFQSNIRQGNGVEDRYK